MSLYFLIRRVGSNVGAKTRNRPVKKEQAGR
jgi:hypothetical protein